MRWGTQSHKEHLYLTSFAIYLVACSRMRRANICFCADEQVKVKRAMVMIHGVHPRNLSRLRENQRLQEEYRQMEIERWWNSLSPAEQRSHIAEEKRLKEERRRLDEEAKAAEKQQREERAAEMEKKRKRDSDKYDRACESKGPLAKMWCMFTKPSELKSPHYYHPRKQRGTGTRGQRRR